MYKTFNISIVKLSDCVSNNIPIKIHIQSDIRFNTFKKIYLTSIHLVLEISRFYKYDFLQSLFPCVGKNTNKKCLLEKTIMNRKKMK